VTIRRLLKEVDRRGLNVAWEQDGTGWHCYLRGRRRVSPRGRGLTGVEALQDLLAALRSGW
jgi:hypothetical protein